MDYNDKLLDNMRIHKGLGQVNDKKTHKTNELQKTNTTDDNSNEQQVNRNNTNSM